MSTIKKRLCDPPAIRLAAAGDPEVAGHFEGALGAIDEIRDRSLRNDYICWVLEIEAEYMKARKELATATAKKMYDLAVWLAAKVDGTAVADKP